MAADRGAVGLAERARLEAELLRRRRGTGSIPALPRTGEAQRFPAVDSQRSMWLRDQVDPWPGARHLPEAVRIRGPLRLEALQLAMNDLAARHEVLRTSFELSGAQLWQVVRPRLEVPLRLVETTPNRLLELVRTEGEAPFDLERGPLVRLVVLRAGPEDHVLLVAMHHSIADGRSSEVMISDLTALYAARLQNLPAELPELPIQFADYAVWQQDRLDGPHGTRLTEYWQARLAGLPATRLPADLVPPAHRSWLSDNFVQPLPPELPGRVAELARHRRTTGFVVYLAAYATLLASLSGDRDLAVSIPTAGRLRPETEHLLGAFFTMALIRADLSGQPSFGQTLDRLTSCLADDLAHAELPLGRQLAMVEPAPDPDRPTVPPPAGTTMVQTLFGVEPDLAPGPNELGLSFEPARYLLPYATRELNARVLHGATGSFCVFQYAAERFSPARVQEMFDRFVAILEAGTADPDACLLGEPGQPAIELADWAPAEPAGTAEPGEPAEPVAEELLAAVGEVWRQALEQCRPVPAHPDRLDADRHLFAAGADLLAMVVFAAGLRSRFGVEVSARQLLGTPTLRGAARAVTAAGQPGTSGTHGSATRAERQ